MATRITVKGQVTIPKKVRVALELAPGDGVEFTPNESGQVIVTKAAPALAAGREQVAPAHGETRVRRSAAEELLALLRGLD